MSYRWQASLTISAASVNKAIPIKLLLGDRAGGAYSQKPVCCRTAAKLLFRSASGTSIPRLDAFKVFFAEGMPFEVLHYESEFKAGMLISQMNSIDANGNTLGYEEQLRLISPQRYK